ncbi:MAG: hypothetical protein ABSG76_18570 [Xanthobacteraceae bacterium]|jgi:hypothetical protein
MSVSIMRPQPSRPVAARATIICIAVGLLASQPALSAPASFQAQMSPRPSVPPMMLPPPPVTPQFNNPGPQLHVERPGNPVEQLAPMDGIGPPPSSLGIK